MDGFRAVAMMLGVLYHVLFSFFTWATPTVVLAQDSTNDWRADVLGELIHGFRMHAFFLVSGFFAHLVLERYGRWGFVRNRARRIALPFTVALALWVPTFYGLSVLALRAGTYHPPDPQAVAPKLFPAYLWFLFYVSLVDSSALLLTPLEAPRALLAARRALAAAWARLLDSAWTPLALSAPMVAVLLAEPFPPYFDLLPRPAWVVYYGVFFLVGWHLHAKVERLETLARRRHAYLWTAVALGLAGELVQHAKGAPTLPTWADHLLWSLYAWCATLGGVGFFVRHFNQPRPVYRYLADASYWMYLSHYPLVLLLQILIAPYAWWGPLKVGLVFGVAVGFSLVTYQLFVRYTFIGRTLHGVREPPLRGTPRTA